MKVDVIRAWKDEDYRASLSAEEQAQVAASPAGVSVLDEELLGSVSGGAAGTNNTCFPPQSCQMY